VTEKEFKKTEADLFASNGRIVLEALETIESQGDTRHIALMAALLNGKTNPEIHRRVFDILNNLKNPEAVSELVQAVQNSKTIELKRELLSACWNSGLDFSAEFPSICRIFLETDFLTAFEAFTIIDTTAPENITEDIANECLTILENFTADFGIEKEKLRSNVVQIFKNVVS